MATCRWCGAENAENAVTCASCGQSVVEPGQQPAAPPPPPPPPMAPPAPPQYAPPAPPVPAPPVAPPVAPPYAAPPQQPPYAPQPQQPQYAAPQQYAPQPQPYAAPQYAPPQQAPKNGLVNAILVTILCCWPLGGVAIYFATQVDKRWNAGDFQGARDAAKKANLFATLAAVLGLVASCIYVIAMVASEGGSTYTY